MSFFCLAGLNGKKEPLTALKYAAYNPQANILVAIKPTNFRKRLDGTACICRAAFSKDPYDGVVHTSLIAWLSGIVMCVWLQDAFLFGLNQQKISPGQGL